MIRNAIAASDESIPAVGLGTNSFTMANRGEAARLLHRLCDLGRGFVDTAPAYGESEAVIGAVLRDTGRRHEVFLASKVVGDGTPRREGPGLLESAWDGITGLASFERTLQRLGTDYLDLLCVHSLLGADRILPQMLRWKEQGRVRLVGATAANPAQRAALPAILDQYPLDYVGVDASLANRDALRETIPVLANRGIAAGILLPLGGRRGNLVTLANERGLHLPSVASDIGAPSWSVLLLKYLLSVPGVTCVLPGASRLAHLDANLGAAEDPLPDTIQRHALERYWQELIPRP